MCLAVSVCQYSLFISPSLSAYLSLSFSLSLCFCLWSVWLCVCCLCLALSVALSLSPCLSLSLPASPYLSIPDSFSSLSLCNAISVYCMSLPSLSLSMSLSASLSLSLSPSLRQSVSLSVYLYLFTPSLPQPLAPSVRNTCLLLTLCCKHPMNPAASRDTPLILRYP